MVILIIDLRNCFLLLLLLTVFSRCCKKFLKGKTFIKKKKKSKNVRKSRYIKLLKKDERRNYLIYDPNYHSKKWFSEKLFAIEIKKTELEMNKIAYLGFSILYLIKVEICNLS